MKIPRRRLLLVTLALATLALATFAATPLTAAGGDDGQNNKHGVRGGGTSMVAGGTGAPSFIPVMTKFAFNWSGSTGRFECLALMPSTVTGAESGDFEVNAMYVTGTISSADVKGNTAVLKGMAVITGIGASVPPGSLKPFTLTVTSGGPGATLVLVVPGFTFNEIVIEGEIAF